MAITARWMRQLFTRSASSPRVFPTSGFKVLEANQKIEEENWEWYRPGLFYPVRIGEVFQSKYQVLGKLGYGTRSTAWLCRDLKRHKYVTLKVCELDAPSIQRELDAYERLDATTTSNPGALFIRELLDSFKIASSAGCGYICMVHEPLGMSMETLRQLSPGQKLSKDLLKAFVRHLFMALDCLHTDVKMIHADLQARNIHLRVEDESILRDFEESEMKDPSPRKYIGDDIVYQSRGLKIPKSHGRPVLCDFGEARFGQETYLDDIQPYVYRAPEVILDIPWTYSVDIWNAGVMIWDMFENNHLFSAKGDDGNSSSLYHLAEMVAILGHPPLEYLRRSETSWQYFDNAGNWKCAAKIPDISLEGLEKQLKGENKALFLCFMRKMLQWVPEKRYSAKQLLDHPWLRD